MLVLPTAAAVQVYMAWCVLAIQHWALRVELVTNVIVKDAMCTSKGRKLCGRIKDFNSEPTRADTGTSFTAASAWPANHSCEQYPKYDLGYFKQKDTKRTL
jgi:hypothetical protein